MPRRVPQQPPTRAAGRDQRRAHAVPLRPRSAPGGRARSRGPTRPAPLEGVGVRPEGEPRGASAQLAERRGRDLRAAAVDQQGGRAHRRRRRDRGGQPSPLRRTARGAAAERAAAASSSTSTRRRSRSPCVKATHTGRLLVVRRVRGHAPASRLGGAGHGLAQEHVDPALDQRLHDGGVLAAPRPPAVPARTRSLR